MTNHLANGFHPDKDLVFPGRPEHPEMRESVSIWMFEKNGEFGFPRMGIEAEAWSWEDRMFHANFAWADGRVMKGTGRGPAPPAIDADGRPAIFGAGPLTFRCVEPFRRWTLTYDGPVIPGHVTEEIHGGFEEIVGKGGAETRPVRLEAELTMVTPAWGQEFSTDIEKMDAVEAANAQAMGLGYRYEHHFRAVGTLTVDGRERDFEATGTRIHRQSIRRLEGFIGHCWLSAVFPDGSAFGCLAYPPTEEGGDYSYNDAVIYQNGRLYQARIIEAPLLSRLVPHGDDVSVVLESELGRTRIAGETTLVTYRLGNPHIGGMNLQQGGALFTWNGQSAYGMVERSRHESLTVVPDH